MILAHYQQEAVSWWQSRKRGILGDAIGLGKTVSAIAGADTFRTPVLVVCPKSLKPQWDEHIAQFSSNPASYAVTNYEQLNKWNPAPTVIFDEATYIKSPKALRTVTSIEYAMQADNVLFLTATPVRNHIPDFFTMLFAIFPSLHTSRSGDLRTDLYRSYKNFVNTHFDVEYFEVQGRMIEKIKKLNPGSERVIGPMLAHALLKRDKAMLNLPPLSQEFVSVPWAAGQRKTYEAALANVLLMSEGESKHIDNLLARMTRLRQAALAPGLFGGPGGSGKTEYLKEVLRENAEIPTLVFTNYAEYGRQLCTVLDSVLHRPCVCLDGSMSERVREQSKSDFLSGKSNVFILSAQAGGFGLNLQRAQLVIWTDLPWTPDVWEQGTGRAWRRGQENPVHELVLGMPDSIDGKVLRLLRRKERIANEAYAMRELWREMKEGQ